MDGREKKSLEYLRNNETANCLTCHISIKSGSLFAKIQQNKNKNIQ